MNFLKRYYPRVLKLSVPLVVFAGLVYGTYVFVSLLCIIEIHSISVRAGLLVGYFILLTYLLINWAMVFVNGPGKLVEKIHPYKLITFYDKFGEQIHDEEQSDYQFNVPDYFLCDVNGYPYYCSECNTIKPLRTHHSNELNKCVAKMDHYCLWIGTILGKTNYKSFLIFSINFTLYFAYYFIVLLIYSIKQVNYRKDLEPSTYLNPNFGILLPVSFGWMGILASLVAQHMYFISKNQTTIEHLKQRRFKRKLTQETSYLNYKFNNTRYVLDVSTIIFLAYKKNLFLKNFKEVFGSHWWHWGLPFNFHEQMQTEKGAIEEDKYWFLKEEFSEEFITVVENKLRNNEGMKFETKVIMM